MVLAYRLHIVYYIAQVCGLVSKNSYVECTHSRDDHDNDGSECIVFSQNCSFIKTIINFYVESKTCLKTCYLVLHGLWF